MITEDSLKEAVRDAEIEVAIHKRKCADIQKQFMEAETLLVDAREVKTRAEEALDLFQRTRTIESSLDDHRDWQAKDFATRAPAILESIKNEPMLPFRTMTDLETISAWPKSRYDRK